MVYLDGARAIGEVRFARATVGRQLVCTDGTFNNQHRIALDLTGLECRGDVLLNSTASTGRHFSASGQILLRDAHLTRDLNFSKARLYGGEGLDARGIQVGGCLAWAPDPPPEGHVNFSHAVISFLNDTAKSWPQGKYALTGLTYQSITYSELEQRKTWLRHTSAYSPQAYMHLARVYRLAGREEEAQKILVASQRDMRDKNRGHLPRHSRLWSWFLDKSVGYGYKLHRPFLLLLIVGIAGGFIYWGAQHANLIVATAPPHLSAAEPPEHGTPTFYPFPYSFQLLIPGLDLRETSNWLPDATKNGWGLFMMIFTWFMVIFGWVLATAVAAGVTRMFRQR
jgi:hypothetical protein